MGTSYTTSCDLMIKAVSYPLGACSPAIASHDFMITKVAMQLPMQTQKK